MVLRAKIVLLAAEAKRNDEIGVALAVSRQMAGLWRRRFIEKVLPGLEKDATRGGRRATKRQAMARRIIEWTTGKKSANATHWSCRSVAAALGTSSAMVNRVWRAKGLKPHLVRTFKVSNDPQFVEKLVDVVGLYLNPPEHSLVLSCEEKSQIQALDRTQPMLPLKAGACGTMTHDYVRHGTTTLFTALEMAEGKVIARCLPRHPHQEWIKFLDLIDAQTAGTWTCT